MIEVNRIKLLLKAEAEGQFLFPWKLVRWQGYCCFFKLVVSLWLTHFTVLALSFFKSMIVHVTNKHLNGPGYDIQLKFIEPAIVDGTHENELSNAVISVISAISTEAESSHGSYYLFFILLSRDLEIIISVSHHIGLLSHDNEIH